jgi:hypothetical protein
MNLLGLVSYCLSRIGRLASAGSSLVIRGSLNEGVAKVDDHYQQRKRRMAGIHRDNAQANQPIQTRKPQLLLHRVIQTLIIVLLIPQLVLPQVAWDPVKKTLLTGTAVILPACVSSSASTTAYTCNSPQPLITYTGAFISVSWIPDRNNSTQTPTLNLGPGPKNLKDAAGQPLLIPSVIAGSQYIVAYDGTNIRVVSGPGAIPTMGQYQQNSPLLCYDTNDAHTANFACSRNPSGATMSTGSEIALRFAATTNGANPCVDVETSGCAQISFSDGSPVPAGSMAGDDSGTENTYLLSFDADDDLWIMMNQLLPSSGAPAVASCGTGAAIVGTDRGGTVTEGTLATGCTLTFHTPASVAPGCSVSSQSGLIFTYSTSATALTITNVGALSSTKIGYVCAR